MEELDVLVVGAGPTGLSLALDLHRWGLRCRVVDKEIEPPPWSKAQLVHARTLEIFESLGVAGDVRPCGKPLHGFNFYEAPSLKRIAHVTFGSVDSQAGAFLSISQRDTELCLAKAYARAGGKIERPVRLESFTQDENGVTAKLVHPDGRIEEVRAAYIVGCDGAHSTVRDAIGLAFEGSTYEQRLIQADVRIDMSVNVEGDEIVAFTSPDGIVALFPLPGDHRYRMLVPLLEKVDYEPTLENFQMLMKRFGPPDAVVSDPVWMVGFRIHCRMVDRYRAGRAFVAGDAAHIHSPAGGQGMNTGIQDAHNLAWKLALVRKGHGREALLDSYDAERRPVAANTLAATDTGTRRGLAAMSFRHPVAIAIRNRLFGFITSIASFTSRGAQALSMLDIHYPNSPIVRQDRPSILDANVLASPTVELPSVRDWMDFGNGPAPGDRAPDVLTSDRDDATRLHDVIRGTSHTLLLFDGAAHTQEGYANLASISKRVKERYGDRVRSIAIVPLSEKPASFEFGGTVLLDTEGAIHERYGARSECLYLIRPDGHVGYRSQPADEGKLLAYLETILV
jgi:2-polyprenyl-6-methoxyphenol hydroxylase-like FAD-dependent oxidoreductase